MPTHTNEPWTVEEDHDIRDRPNGFHRIESQSHRVQVAIVGTGIHDMKDEEQANAQHIVHCVNTYPALVAALVAALELAQEKLAFLSERLGKRLPLDLSPTKAETAIKAALALARQEGGT